MNHSNISDVLPARAGDGVGTALALARIPPGSMLMSALGPALA